MRRRNHGSGRTRALLVAAMVVIPGAILQAEGPFCFTGAVSVLPSDSNCRDGASHQLAASGLDTVKLKALGEIVAERMRSFEGARCCATLCGNWVDDPECAHLAVYFVGVADDFDQHIKPLLLLHRVIALTEPHSAPWQNCQVIPADGFYPATNTSVFGPASRPACESWVKVNCTTEAKP